MADNEREYWLTREHIIFMTMVAEGNVANQAKHEIVTIVSAWYRGQITPRREAPTMEMLLADDPDWPPPSAPAAPVEIVGGVSGLQKHLVKLAEENRDLDPVALKELYDQHEVVVAVWEDPSVTPGPGFLTLKGTEHLLAQAKRGAKKIRATMTAIPASNREHAEILQQAFASSDPPPAPAA
jgi:hypothetical protein